MHLSHNLCQAILSHIPIHRRPDLYALLFTSKSFHAATEPVFYSHLVFTDVHRIRLFTRTLTHTSPRLATHVRTFGINLSELRVKPSRDAPPNVQIVLRREFWEDVRAALHLMSTLHTLILVQTPGIRMNFTWILDGEWPFKLREAKLHLVFDNHVAQFLNSQAEAGRLRAVQIYKVSYSEHPDMIDEVHLPTIDVLDISLSLLVYIQPTSLLNLTYLQLLIDTPANNLHPTTLQDILSYLLQKSPTRGLRGLSILDIPPHLSTPLLAHLSDSITSLTTSLLHLSHFHLPTPYPTHSENRSQFLASLVRFHRLHSLELSLNAWDLSPTPTTTTTSHSAFSGKDKTGPGIPGMHPYLTPNQNPNLNPNTNTISTLNNPSSSISIPSPAAQKALVSELKTFCPTLRIVVLWLGKMRFRWAFVGDGVPIRCVNVLNEFEAGEVRVGDGSASGSSKSASASVGASASAGVGASASASVGAGVLGMRGVPSVPPRIENAAVGGEWHHRLETNQWPGYSTLWCSC